MPKYDVHSICQKPEQWWTLRERDEMYWFHFHEVEFPTEADLQHCANRYCRPCWYQFLLECFPSEKNYRLLHQRHGTTRSGRRAINALLRRMISQVPKPGMALLEIISRNGGLRTRKRANKLLAYYPRHTFTFEI